MVPIRLDQWAVRSPEPVAAQTGEGLALLSTDQQTYIVLNESAAAIWDRLAAPLTLRALADSIAKAFELPQSDAADAVLEVVAHLREQNIVAVQDEPFRRAGES